MKQHTKTPEQHAAASRTRRGRERTRAAEEECLRPGSEDSSPGGEPDPGSPETEVLVAVRFDFNNKEIRAVMRSGDPWFIGPDLVKMLGHSNDSMAFSGLDDDERDYAKVATPGGPQKVNIISESGLYHLILNSRMPKAIEFRRWVKKTVLPTLRRTGKFEMGGQPDQGEPSANGRDTEAGITITLPRVGRYIVVIAPNGERRIRPTLFSDAIPAMAMLDSRAMAYSFMTAFMCWEKLQQLGTFNVNLDGGFTLDKFTESMLASADLARQILYTHDKPLLNRHH